MPAARGQRRCSSAARGHSAVKLAAADTLVPTLQPVMGPKQLKVCTRTSMLTEGWSFLIISTRFCLSSALQWARAWQYR